MNDFLWSVDQLRLQQISVCAHAVFKSFVAVESIRFPGKDCAAYQFIFALQTIYLSHAFRHFFTLPCSSLFITSHPDIGVLWLGSRPDLLASTVLALPLTCGIQYFTEDQLSTELRCELDMVLNYCVGFGLQPFAELRARAIFFSFHGFSGSRPP
jgi:hypothetical protein